MCGIIGYIGPKDVVPVLIDGLRRLEYRGYDSAGVAVVSNGAIDLRRSAGKLANLEQVIVSGARVGLLFVLADHVAAKPEQLVEIALLVDFVLPQEGAIDLFDVQLITQWLVVHPQSQVPALRRSHSGAAIQLVGQRFDHD